MRCECECFRVECGSDDLQIAIDASKLVRPTDGSFVVEPGHASEDESILSTLPSLPSGRAGWRAGSSPKRLIPEGTTQSRRAGRSHLIP
jgi:hypothetical protein